MKECIHGGEDRWDRGGNVTQCECVCVAEVTASIGDRMLSDKLCRTELALIFCLSLCLSLHLCPYSTSPCTSPCLSVCSVKNVQMVLLMNSYSIFQFVSITPTVMQLMRMYCPHLRKCIAWKNKSVSGPAITMCSSMLCSRCLQHSCCLC